jgi:hypothetical protein
VVLAACGGSVEEPASSFDLENLFIDVFNPLPGEKILVMIDVPKGVVGDNASAWYMRRGMAQRWHKALLEISSDHGYEVLPLLKYPATGAHSGPLPEEGELDGQVVKIDEVLSQANIVLALTEYSATAPLIEATKRHPNLRVASMPTVSVDMESTALSADYDQVAERVRVLQERLNRASGAFVEFSTGDQMLFDLRHRHAEADDGQLHADEEGARVINLPSGEAYVVPYEGEIEDDPSGTAGTIPFVCENDITILEVENNRVVNVVGAGGCAEGIRGFLAVDDARRNIAELGLGCNDKAVISGNVLQDEKVQGMHWAFGLSEALGGTIGVDDFEDPKNALHWDIVYPTGGAVEVTSLILLYEDGSREEIMKGGQYTVFSDRLQDVQVVENIALVWFFLAAVSACVVAWDVEKSVGITRRMNIGWAWICMVFGVIGLVVYFRALRRSNGEGRDIIRAVAATLYCATGAITGTFFMMILSAMSPEVDNASPGLTLVMLLGLPYLFGLLLFRAPFIASLLKGRYGTALRASAFPELLSVLFVLAGIFPATLLPINLLPEFFGMADPRTLLLLSLGGLVGAMVAYPFNLWMVRQGYAVWPSDESVAMEDGQVSYPRIREAWRILLVGLVLMAVSLGMTLVIIA